MNASSDAKRAWLTDVLGVGVSSEPAMPANSGGKQQKISLASVSEALQSAGDFVSKLFASPEIAEVQKKLNAEVLALEQLGLNTQRMKLDHAEQARALEAAASLTDTAARETAIKRARKRLAQMQDHAHALAKATQKIMGETKGAPSKAQQSAIYQNALEDRYGLKIEVPKGMTNTHLDRVFDMMGTVPRDQTKHRKLKKLSYTKDTDWQSSGAYGGAEILMGDFGDAKGAEDYKVNGETVPANSFDVTTLHEMGHALDDAKRLMDKHGSKPGCGGWKRESPASVAAAMVKHFMRTQAVSQALTPTMVQRAIAVSLTGSAPDAPDGIDPIDWATVLNYLRDVVSKSHGSANPWFKSTGVDVDGRSYVESYTNDWWSYEIAARTQTRVNNYQWRSPAEWFAEVYAITWLSKKKPPAGIDPAVAAYMWQG